MKPILSQDIPAFDASLEATISFIYNGNQPYANELVITTQDSKEVYHVIENSRQLYHTIAPNSISNNTAPYLAKIRVLFEDGSYSDYSDSVLIYCYSTPKFGFNEISNGEIISNSSISLTLDYSQEQGDLLSEYEVILYDHGYSELYNSGILYSINGNVEIKGLEDSEVYYLRALGKTQKNMEIDTGVIEITVKYSSPTIYTSMILENDCRNGYIKVTSNIISVAYESSSEKLSFLNNSQLDLTNEYLAYNDGFDIEKDFSLLVDLMNPEPYEEIISLSGENFLITIKYMVYTAKESTASPYSYFVLNISDGYANYVLYSDTMSVLQDTNVVRLCLSRKNGFYDFSCTSK